MMFCQRFLGLVRSALALAVVLLLAGLSSASLAGAALPTTTMPWWHLRFAAAPTNLPPGGAGQITVTASDIGDKAVNGGTSIVTVTDKLPEDLKESASAIFGTHGASPLASPLVCSLATLSCTFSGTLIPGESLRVTISMKEVPLGAVSGEENEATVEGGGASVVSLRKPLVVSSVPTPFGVENYELIPEAEDGAVDTEAGSHPFQLTTAIALNLKTTKVLHFSSPVVRTELESEEAGLVKDLNFKWPEGLIGNPTVFPRCTISQFSQQACPKDTVVGKALTAFNEPAHLHYSEDVAAVYNLEPDPGEPARFGFDVDNAFVYIDPSIRTGGDYGITVSVKNISQLVGVLSSVVTVWGVPGDPRHGLGLGESNPPPFLSLPTSCSGPLQTTLEADSWAQPGNFTSYLPSVAMPALEGCNRLPFDPEIKVSPDGQEASKPTGLSVDVHVPQEGVLNPAGLADSNIKDITVALPAGLALNPSGADGLQACSEAQIGYLPGESHPPGELHFTSGLPSPFCPDASKIATVKIRTPLLPNPLEGAVYLASPQNFKVFPQENPFESLIAMYLIAEDPVSGSLVKLPGRVSLNESTGQIVSTFEDTPQLAFEDAELHFFGGERAPLATPARCGTYTTNAVFTPWSGNPSGESQSRFQITTGPNGSPCPGASLPFSPSLAAGTINNQAGSFSALTTTLSREDGQQGIQSVRLHMPPGFSGLLSNVALCGDAQANAGTCGPESEIGETIVSVGLGGDPFTVTGGKVYITGPYNGIGACTVGTPGCAPFGLSIVNPAKAGPFNLQEGRPVIVRAKIEVDPSTAALTITTDEKGEHAIPHIIDGIPLQIKHVNVTINRPGFTFNPSNCSPMAITGTITSAEEQSRALSAPFEVANCASLAFAPKFQVFTQGKTSKADGASLTARLSYPAAPFGTQANIARVTVDLPKQLPSRLTTLQKACTDAQFEANPAGCPAASFIGHATVTTPLLPVPLSGPAIFVSHGGEAFPSLIMVLQGYGVTVDLVGTTFISKAGITSTTFKTVPDTPFNTFELTLPEGPYSALAANVPVKAKYSLCGQKLTMPTAFLAQNGMELHQNTNVTVTGCAKVKTLTRSEKLAAALKACHKHKNKKKRAACEKTAHKKYGPLKKKTNKKKQS
jgi:hypothetical protein